jgi:hypothetical protein
MKDSWFAEREEPADAWKPMTQLGTELPDGSDPKAIVDLFNSTKSFHDRWREEIFGVIAHDLSEDSDEEFPIP